MTQPAKTTRTQKYLPHDDRKLAIAAAARALIVEKGFEGLRTRDIADMVGINIATLHYHVPSKEALIELVTASLRNEFIAQHARHPREGLDPVARLRLELEEFRETRTTNPDVLVVLEELSRRARHDDKVAAIIHPMKARWRQGFVDILADGRASGHFRADLDPDAAAQMIIGAIVTFQHRPIELFFKHYDAVVAEIFRSVMTPDLKKDLP